MNTITAQQFRLATAMPRTTDVPANFLEVLTPAAKKALNARDAAYDKWCDVEADAQSAWLAVDAAARADTAALVDAVKNDQPDPGTKNEDKARRAVVVAVERVRQAKQAVDAADREWSRHVEQLMPAYLPVAAQAIRDGAEAWQQSLNTAKAEMVEADARLRATFDGAQFVRDFCAPVVQFQPPSNTPEIDWPRGMADEIEYAQGVAANIERVAARHGTLPADQYTDA